MAEACNEEEEREENNSWVDVDEEGFQNYRRVWT